MRKTSLSALTLGLFGATSLACGNVGDEGNGDGGAGSDASADAQPGDVGAGGDAPVALPYKYVIVYDNQIPDCTTTGPGTDLDAIELKRGGAVIGVGKTGSAAYSAGGALLMSTPCAMMACGAGGNTLCKYADMALKANIEGVADGEVKQVGDDVGYFSLNGGSVALEIGGPTGAGAGQEIKAGDTLRIYEVDLYYQGRNAALTPPKAYSGCVCTPDKYDIYISPTLNPADFATMAKKLTAATYQTENTACGAITATSSGCGSTEFTIPTL